MAGAEKTFDRDLWEDSKSAVKNLASVEDAIALKKSGAAAVVTVYAPWCQYSQKMEDEYEKFAVAMEGKIGVYKLRGDEIRDYVVKEFNTASFPTVNIVTPDGTAIKYESEKRDVESFQQFVEKMLEKSLV